MKKPLFSLLGTVLLTLGVYQGLHAQSVDPPSNVSLDATSRAAGLESILTLEMDVTDPGVEKIHLVLENGAASEIFDLEILLTEMDPEVPFPYEMEGNHLTLHLGAHPNRGAFSGEVQLEDATGNLSATVSFSNE